MIHSQSFIIGLVLLVVFSISLSAGVPTAINYQGFLTDGSGSPVPDNSYSVQFSIYDAALGGTSKWTEIQTVSTSDGLFAVLLGTINPISDSVFSGPTRYLAVKVGTDPEMVPRTMIVTVPFAMRVSTVDGSTGGTVSGNLYVGGKANIGDGNTNDGVFSFVAGEGSDAAGAWAVVSGGNSNVADGDQSAVSGGADNIATGTESVIAGGSENTASGIQASVGGGSLNFATGVNSIVTGGSENTASAFGSTVAGGSFNLASDSSATVGGGSFNKARGSYSVVAGGGGATQADSNSAIGDHSTIGGGFRNTATNIGATIGGGAVNTADYFSTVGGGASNTADQWYCTVAGGQNNAALNDYSTVAGGQDNTASGTHSTVLGGKLNLASGRSSLAAGYQAKATHEGAFVWSGYNVNDFNSSADNEFSIRATGGTRIYSNAGLTSGVLLVAGGSSWSAVSDSSLKRNVREVDYNEVLNKVVELPISQWSYESQDASIEHIGPMAQDFHRLFGLGEDDKHINTLDPDGIALAAIKALYNQNQILQNELAELRERLDKIEDE